MISPPNDRSRPQAAPESFGGDTQIIPDATDRPTWDTLVEATVTAQVVGYELGYQHGLRDAADELDAQVLRDRAAAVVRNAARDLHVAGLRRSA